MIQNTALAKTVYWLSGQASKIKYYGHTYRLANEREWLDAEGDMEMMFVKDGRRWCSIRLTWKLLDLAVKLDHNHFDHWALNHIECAERICMDCGGMICRNEDDDG